MSGYSTEDIRNIALVGHGGCGKTMLMEFMLFEAGAIGSTGSIEKGTTVGDFEAEEKAHKHSLSAAIVGCEYDSKQINIIDTPGYPDFMGRAIPALAAVETAAVVIDARSGIQATTRRMMEAAAERGLGRMIVVNKVDAEDVDLSDLMDRITETFGSECLPINLPTGGGTGVAECFFQRSGEATDFSSVEDAHTRIVDQVVEVDEELMELYLEHGEELDPARLHDAFEKAMREGHLVPVCFAAGEAGVGVRELLDVISRVMPNPNEGNSSSFARGEGEDSEPAVITGDPNEPVVAHVFKVAIDPFVGRLGVFRIHRGAVTKDTQLFVGDGRKPFKVAHLFKLQGKEHVEIERGVPGDICAVAKIDEIHYDSILHESHDDDLLRLNGARPPEPMFGLAIQAKTRGDEQKLSDTLARLSAEDPCFVVEQNAATHETVVRGLGDLHLRVSLERMKDRYNVEVETRPPKIPYRETITAPAEGHHRHKKQTGGAGQFGEVFLRVEPMTRGTGFEFVSRIAGGVIPTSLIPAVEKGVRQVLDTGAIAGYRLEDVRVTVYDGKFHPVDSKEVAFVAAGKKAFVDAVMQAKPIVLEPIVDIDITVPQDKMGDIAGDLSGKRGRISGTIALAGGMVTVSGQAPLSELETYQSELKSVTGGAGSYSMHFSHYDPVPRPIQDTLMAKYRPAQDDE